MSDPTPASLCPQYVPEGDQCGFFIEGGFCRQPDRFRCHVHDYFMLGKISVSEANVWMKCHKQYQYEYLQGIQVIPRMLPKNMRIGRAIHEGVELLHLGKSPDVNLDQYFSEEDIKERGIITVLLHKLATFPIDGLTGTGCLPEHRFTINLPDTPEIHGVMDVFYVDHFDEYKTTTNPDFYTTPHFLQSQLATYFLYAPELAWATMKVIRIPQLKSTGQYKEESGEKFVNRVRVDVDKRPAYYFSGYDKETGVWGKKFYRSEFDLEEVLARYRHIMYEKRLAIKRNLFMKNENHCLYPVPCQFLSICESGGISDLIYQRKEVIGKEVIPNDGQRTIQSEP